MSLNVIWYILFLVVVAGYLILDGFDLGVGALHPFAAKSDLERRIVLNSIGPVWDGNEVWLILAGGVLFAAFPFVYASLFSGFYVAFMLVLLCLILRAVAIEFRSKRPMPRWRSAWDWVFFLTSAGLSLLLGVALGNILLGLPLDQQGNITLSLVDLLSPYALLIGVTTLVMLAMHGAIYLTLKTEDALCDRILGWLPRMMIAFLVLDLLVALTTLVLGLPLVTAYLSQPWLAIFPIGALVAFALTWRFIRQARYFNAFWASSAVIALTVFSGAAGMFPNLLISTTNPAYNLTIYNAASQPNTLTVMLIIALIGLPFVLLYTAGVYYIFRGKVKIESESY